MGSAVSAFGCCRFPEDADRRGTLELEPKYSERWFGLGEVGEELTDEASVKVCWEPWEDERERTVL
jgi:hypothetical protein